MVDATSTVPKETELDEDAAARLRAARELQDRLADHGATFYRRIIQGAFERIYQPDGSYRLREIGSGLFLEDLTTAEGERRRAVGE
jgi:hypothetical protein